MACLPEPQHCKRKEKKKKKQLGMLIMVVHTYNSNTWLRYWDCKFKANLGYIAKPRLKKKRLS
jgi:hypothetical protein